MMGKKDVAELLNISTRSVDRLIKQGAFPKHKIGGLIKIKRDDVLKYIEAQKETV